MFWINLKAFLGLLYLNNTGPSLYKKIVIGIYFVGRPCTSMSLLWTTVVVHDVEFYTHF